MGGVARSDLLETTPASHSQGCPRAVRSLWVGGAGCHGPWAGLEVSLSFWSWLILATISPTPKPGQHSVDASSCGQTLSNCEKDFIRCRFPLGPLEVGPAAQAADQV